MKALRTVLCVLALAAMAGTAAAEKTVAVNDPALPGVFDQPSAAVSGSVVHVAYIGADNVTGPFRVYYAAVNAGANFTDVSLTRNTSGFLVTPPVAVDNTAAGNDAYVDARHPRIALRSSNDVVILFQAKPVASADPSYVLYLARLTLVNHAVVQQTVRMVTGISGFTEDATFGVVSTDNTARVAYAGRQATTGAFNVYYARISLDTAAVTGSPGTPLLLSAAAGTSGVRPLPSLKLDSQRRAQVAWAANDNSSAPNGVYYALVKEVNGADTVAIAATEVLGRSRKWGNPNLLVASSLVIVLAADETIPNTAGAIGLVSLNPDADNQDGSPVQITQDSKFLRTPPGEAILPENYSAYRPEAYIDALSQIHITGYGVNGTRCSYYAFKLVSSEPYVQFVRTPATVGLDSTEFPVSLDGDYTRAAIGFLTDGKALVFWSGQGTIGRNLDVTGLPTAKAIPFEQSGCAVAAGGALPRRSGAVADALLLLVPAAVLGIRRARYRTFGQ